MDRYTQNYNGNWAIFPKDDDLAHIHNVQTGQRYEGKVIDRLAMYEEMHEIYVKHTGDTVYYIGQGECWECIFGLVGFTEDGGIDFMLIDVEGEGINCDYSEWGKTVFPTQEEAESALKTKSTGGD